MPIRFAQYNEFDTFPSENAAVVFCHVPKCAGISLSALFHNSGFDCRVLTSYRDWLDFDIADAQPGRRGAPLFLCGHETFGTHELIPEPTRIHYFTFLRDPVSLFRSYWNFQECKLQPFLSFDEQIMGYPRNIMVQYLGNGSFERARRNLEEMICLIGLVERFNESLSMLSQYFGVDVSQYMQLNVSRRKTAESDSGREREIRALNSLDIELYEWAVDIFHARIKEFKRRQGRAFTVPATSFYDRKKSPALSSDEVRDLIRNNRCDEALEKLLRLEKEHPEEAHIPRSIALLHEKHGRWNEARICHERSIDIFSGFIMPYFLFLKKYFPEMYLDFIRTELRKALPAATDMPDSALNRALLDIICTASAPAGRPGCPALPPDEAEQLARQGLRIDPLRFTLVQNLIHILNTGGRQRECITLLREHITAFDSPAETIEARKLLATFLSNFGETDEAAELTEALRREDHSAVHILHKHAPGVVGHAPLHSAIGPGSSVLVIRAAPVPLLDYFAEKVRGLDAAFDLAAQPAILDHASGLGVFRTIHSTGPGYYQFSREPGSLFDAAGTRSYDHAVILSSNLDVPLHAQWTALLAALNLSCFHFFPLDNFYSGEEHCLCFDLSETGTPETTVNGETS